MPSLQTTWIALITSLPTANATARMRVWRRLKGLGCGVLRDGVYLLPDSAGAREALAVEAAAIGAAGGQANLVEISPAAKEQAVSWRRLFDRSADYAQLVAKLRSLRAAGRSTPAATLARKVSALRRRFADLGAIDFFPGAARTQAQALLEETERAVEAVQSPGEPSAVTRPIPRLRRADFQGRLWATRARPWVDRLASAWLIRRFIDSKARFVWIEKPEDCPARAVGFDFDGAQFTHVGNRVTFEVLISAFGLDADPGLNRLALTVHYLDVGGIPADDAAGLKTILLGARGRTRNDHRLLAEAMRIFDFVHCAHKGDSAYEK